VKQAGEHRVPAFPCTSRRHGADTFTRPLLRHMIGTILLLRYPQNAGYFLLHTIPAALIHRHCDASLLLLFRVPGRRVVHTSPGSLRPPPWLGGAIEDVVGTIQGKVVGQRGCAMPAQRMSLGDDLLAVHEPTRIESFTERTEGMTHTALLAARTLRRGATPPSACGAVQSLSQEWSKMRTIRAWQARGVSLSVHTVLCPYQPWSRGQGRGAAQRPDGSVARGHLLIPIAELCYDTQPVEAVTFLVTMPDKTPYALL
jgi:hypothetical protein